MAEAGVAANAEREGDVRAILLKKEEEVKEMLAPEKEMHGEADSRTGVEAL